jgi:hypothetical protein
VAHPMARGAAVNIISWGKRSQPIPQPPEPAGPLIVNAYSCRVVSLPVVKHKVDVCIHDPQLRWQRVECIDYFKARKKPKQGKLK